VALSFDSCESAAVFGGSQSAVEAQPFGDEFIERLVRLQVFRQVARGAFHAFARVDLALRGTGEKFGVRYGVPNGVEKPGSGGRGLPAAKFGCFVNRVS
jgi:TolB-like protein